MIIISKNKLVWFRINKWACFQVFFLVKFFVWLITNWEIKYFTWNKSIYILHSKKYLANCPCSRSCFLYDELLTSCFGGYSHSVTLCSTVAPRVQFSFLWRLIVVDVESQAVCVLFIHYNIEIIILTYIICV